ITEDVDKDRVPAPQSRLRADGPGKHVRYIILAEAVGRPSGAVRLRSAGYISSQYALSGELPSHVQVRREHHAIAEGLAIERYREEWLRARRPHAEVISLVASGSPHVHSDRHGGVPCSENGSLGAHQQIAKTGLAIAGLPDLRSL